MPGVVKTRITSDHSRKQRGVSLNETIDKSAHSLEYVRMTRMVECASMFGPGCGFSEVDAKHAFRNLDRSRETLHLHCYNWKLPDRLKEGVAKVLGRALTTDDFVDRAVSFGSTSAPKLFDGLAVGLKHISQTDIDKALGQGNAWCMHLLDDQGTIARTPELAAAAFDIVENIYKDVGLPLSEPDKQGRGLVEGEWLGWWLCCKSQTTSLPKDKRDAYRADCQRVLRERNSTKLQLLQLAGRLQHASLVFPGARPLINSMWALAYKINQNQPNHYSVKNTNRVREDASLFAEYLSVNHTWPFHLLVEEDEWPTDLDWPHDPGDSGHLYIVGDASGIDGAGVYGKGWCSTHRWLGHERADKVVLHGETSSTYLETMTAVRAIHTLIEREDSHNCRIEHFCDSQCTREVFRRGRSAVPMINDQMRQLATVLVKRRVDVRVRWYNRDVAWIKIADALSHCPPRSQAQLLVSRHTGEETDFVTLWSPTTAATRT